jgi:ABC-2 type transport system ATP-binding protein
METVIELNHVTKRFRFKRGNPKDVKNHVLKLFNKTRFKIVHDEREILSDVSLDIKKGEFVGIMGRNGVGKSTILKILSGIYQPTEGTVKISGKIAPVLELGAGFADELNGIENVYLNASILGYSYKQVVSKLQEIVDFSELGEQILEPVRNYSSGMLVRLAFSVACNLEAQVLLFDEVLAVGDLGFQQKCLAKIKQLHAEKKTIVLVSHSPEQIAEHCDRCILVDDGRIVFDGSAKEGAAKYSLLFAQNASATTNS